MDIRQLILYNKEGVYEASFVIHTLQEGEAIGLPPLEAVRIITLKAAAERRYRLRFNFYPDESSAIAMINPISEHTIGVGEVWVGGDLFREDEPGSGRFIVAVPGKKMEIYIDGEDTGKRPETQTFPGGHFWDKIHDVLDTLEPGDHVVTVRFTG